MQLVSVMTLFLPQERHEERHGVALSMPPIKQFPYTYSRQMDHMLAVLLHTGSDERVNGLRSHLSVFAFKDVDQTETRHGLLVQGTELCAACRWHKVLRPAQRTGAQEIPEMTLT